MICSDCGLPILGLSVSALAVVVWAFAFIRSIIAYRRDVEKRHTWLVMAGAALLASLGTLASAIGFAVQRDLLPEVVTPDFWSFIASVGRGALLMAGLIVAATYRPPRKA